jgi:hypothetical protein
VKSGRAPVPKVHQNKLIASGRAPGAENDEVSSDVGTKFIAGEEKFGWSLYCSKNIFATASLVINNESRLIDPSSR